MAPLATVLGSIDFPYIVKYTRPSPLHLPYWNKSKAESENGLREKEALLVVEPCKMRCREALQVLERLVLHIMCHSTLNTCWYY